MKNKKQKKRIQEASRQNYFIKTELPSPLKIKFDLRKDNMACFIGPKKSLKKKIAKGSASIQKGRNSLPKCSYQVQKPQLKKKQVVLPKKSQSQEIVQGSLNSILTQIEAKGIQYAWSEEERNIQSIQSNNSNQSDELWRVFSDKQALQKSHASTMDVVPTLNYYIDETYNYPVYNYPYNYRNFDEGSVYLLKSDEIFYDPRTTVMIRNIPNKYTIKELTQEIDLSLANTYDFLYLPCDVKNQCNVGYGFINFISTHYLAQFYQLFQGKRWTKFRSQKICDLTYARLQGLNNLINHFQNSKVLNQKDKKFRPIIREFNKIEHLIRSQQLN